MAARWGGVRRSREVPWPLSLRYWFRGLRRVRLDARWGGYTVLRVVPSTISASVRCLWGR